MTTARAIRVEPKTRRSLIVALVIAMTMSLVAIAPSLAGANGSDPTIAIGDSEHWDKIGGVDFTRYDCRFSGVADEISYTPLVATGTTVEFDVACSLVLPSNPSRWSGQIVVEPLDQVVPLIPEGEATRILAVTDEVLFGGQGNRSGYASISYAGTGLTDAIDQEFGLDGNSDGLPDAVAAAVEILADFPAALRSGGESGLIGPDSTYGPVTAVEAMGFSNQGIAMRGAMAFGETHGLEVFDVALPMAANLSLTPDASGLTAPPLPGTRDFGDQRALFLNSEGDVIPNGIYDVFGFAPIEGATLELRVEADDVNRFVYEVAGAAHLDPVNQADLLAFGVVLPGAFDDSSPLEWGAVIRAVFVQMRGWVTDGTSPAPSSLLDDPSDPLAADPAYPSSASVLKAKVDRDSNLNALGGIRLPDVELGVGTYLAVGPSMTFTGDITTEFFQVLAGGFDDLECENLDGEPQFKNHGDYVNQVAKITKGLVNDRFLLKADASEMKAGAGSSGIGACN